MHTIPDIAPFRDKLSDLNEQMADPDFYSDQRRAADVSREQMRLSTLVEKFEAYHSTVEQLKENQAMAADDSVEAELREMAEEEIEPLANERDRLANDVLRFMIPPDATDSRNSVMEIRGGAGGDEANIFAGDLFRMYSRYAETRGWRVEIMSSSPADVGGFKEIIFNMTGEEAYKFLKFESGVHRVQRVPATETQGRIHTSTATVAVLPEAEEVDVQINPQDLDISTTRASGAGGCARELRLLPRMAVSRRRPGQRGRGGRRRDRPWPRRGPCRRRRRRRPCHIPRRSQSLRAQ